MGKAQKPTNQTDTGQSKARTRKSISNNPYPGVELEKLSVKSSRNEDLPISLTQQHSRLHNDYTQRIVYDSIDISGSDDLGVTNDNISKDMQDESIMMNDDEDMDECNSKASDNSANDEFDRLNDAINEKRNESATTQVHQDMENESIKGLSIEIDFEVDGKIEQCVTSITHFTMDLLKKQIQTKAIEGVLALDGKSIMTSEFEDVEAWTIPLRIIKKKQSMLAEMMVLVKTENTAYNLYEDQKEFCDKYLIKVATKRTTMEYVKKIGYLTGTYVKLASEEYYIKDISKRLKIPSGMIDIKKEYTFEKGKRSKVLSVYVIEKKALEINEECSKLTNNRYQFVSYRKTTSEERLASIHHNEMTNVKARYESLYNASLKELILVSSRCHE